MVESGRQVISKRDPILLSFGADHGGRTRGVSDVVGATQLSENMLRRGPKKKKNVTGKRVADELDVNVGGEGESSQGDARRLRDE